MIPIPQAFIIRGITPDNRELAASWVLNNIREHQETRIINHLLNPTSFVRGSEDIEWAFSISLSAEPYVWYGWNPIDPHENTPSWYQRNFPYREFYLYTGFSLPPATQETIVIIPIQYLEHFGNLRFGNLQPVSHEDIPETTHVNNPNLTKKPITLPKKSMSEIFRF